MSSLRFHFPPRWRSSDHVRPFAIVVGATGGIGACVAQEFAQLGFSVVLIARDSRDALAAIREQLLRTTVDAANETAWHGAAPRQVLAVRVDLEADVGALQRAFGDVLASVGEALEVVVSVAGSMQPTLLLGDERDVLGQLKRDLHVDVVGTAVLLQLCGAAMARRGGGTIVLVASQQGIHSFSTGGVAIAGGAAAKQAMAEAAFEELRTRGVRVCTLFAELVNTAAADAVQRFNANIAGGAADLLQPSDVARACVFAAGSRSAAHAVVLRSHFNPIRTTKLFASFLSAKKMPPRPAALVARRPNGRPAAIVTGASQGIGLACAERLAREGFDVALIARSPAPLDLAVASCRAAAGSPDAVMRAFVCDVGDRAQFTATLSEALAFLGRCDVLLANAGTNRRHSSVSANGDVWCSVVETNLLHAMVATAVALPFMVHQRSG
jgi:NAD(P)-dependent dehydrogenase (short-subunit alcohol dehydrogenase family)